MSDTRIDEIADGIYRLSTFVPDVGPTGFTFNQFLIATTSRCCSTPGIRMLFPLGQRRGRAPSRRSKHSAGSPSATSRPTSAVRSTSSWPPRPARGRARRRSACMVSLNDMADRPPVPLDDRVRSSSSASTVCGTSTHPTSPTDGKPGAVRGDDQARSCAATSSPSSATDPRSRSTTCSTLRRRPRTSSAPPASRPPPRRRSAPSPTSTRRRSPSCTAPRAPATAGSSSGPGRRLRPPTPQLDDCARVTTPERPAVDTIPPPTGGRMCFSSVGERVER